MFVQGMKFGGQEDKMPTMTMMMMDDNTIGQFTITQALWHLWQMTQKRPDISTFNLISSLCHFAKCQSVDKKKEIERIDMFALSSNAFVL